MEFQYDTQENGLIGKIPVWNIWLLLLYASDLYKSQVNDFIDIEENPDDIPDLVARILCHQVNRRIHRNLTSGYIAREEILPRIRGSIDLLKTESKGLLDRGRIACKFEELSIDTPRNRYVRDALAAISKIVKDKSLRHQCQSLVKRFRHLGVTGTKPSLCRISDLQFGRKDKPDIPMMEAAYLAFNLALPAESTGDKFLPKPCREIKWIRKIFEKGIAGFYSVNLSDKGWKVYQGKTFYWQIAHNSADGMEIGNFFPSMKTDIVLDDHANSHRIVIDTKFTSLLTRGWYRDETLRSGHIYQIYAYLRSQEGMEGRLTDEATGILLHPSVGSAICTSVSIQNHEIRFATVDLGETAKNISRRLLQVLNLKGLDCLRVAE